MFEVLRRASVQFKNETYEQAACSVLTSTSNTSLTLNPYPHVMWSSAWMMMEENPLSYTKNLLNVLVPPVFNVSC